MTDLPEIRAVNLRRLIGVVSRIHDATMTAGFSAENEPNLHPLLFELVDQGTGRIGTRIVHLDPQIWNEAPADVMDAIAPAPGKIPTNFAGMLFTAEAWIHGNPGQNMDEVLRLAANRQLHTVKTKRSVRITMAVAVDGQWVQLTQNDDQTAPEVTTSATAETNPDHYKGWTLSALSNALTRLVSRIQADLDVQIDVLDG